MVAKTDLKSVGSNPVRVRVPPLVQTKGLNFETFFDLNNSITNPYMSYGTKAFLEVCSI
jgi:hypothetical protein